MFLVAFDKVILAKYIQSNLNQIKVLQFHMVSA